MPDKGDDGGSPGAGPDLPDGEIASFLASGPALGSRAGAFSFLALLAVAGAAIYFHFSGRGESSFAARLDADLLSHAEMTVMSAEEGSRLAVVPPWPQRLYATLRADIALYAAAVLSAALLWGLAMQARARRAAYLVHAQLTRELAELGKRVKELEHSEAAAGQSARPGGVDMKG